MKKILLLMIFSSTACAQWTNIGPGGQSLSSITFYDANIGFACGSAGSLYRTPDGGTTWTLLPSFTTPGLPNRPDWDDYLTKVEADAWWNGGSGKPLFVNEALISLSGATTALFNNQPGTVQNRNFFFWNPNSDTGNVYGTLDMTLLDMHGTVSIGYANERVAPNHELVLDYYNFEPHVGQPYRNWFTEQGKPSGVGADFSIYGYGHGHVIVPIPSH